MFFSVDNLSILCEHIIDESIALIYLDPPLISSHTYTVLLIDESGTLSGAPIVVFEDVSEIRGILVS